MGEDLSIAVNQSDRVLIFQESEVTFLWKKIDARL